MMELRDVAFSRKFDMYFGVLGQSVESANAFWRVHFLCLLVALSARNVCVEMPAAISLFLPGCSLMTRGDARTVFSFLHSWSRPPRHTNRQRTRSHRALVALSFTISLFASRHLLGSYYCTTVASSLLQLLEATLPCFALLRNQVDSFSIDQSQQGDAFAFQQRKPVRTNPFIHHDDAKLAKLLEAAALFAASRFHSGM